MRYDMERSALLTAYDAACRKAAANAWVIGQDPREFPGRMDGDYFAPARDSLRSVEHIFCGRPAFLPAWLCWPPSTPAISR